MPDRVVRVFVSSTFRDMQEERDELVLRVFPELRKHCERRGVVWEEVDLRWGITDEQRAEGKVLPICLEEIKRCRPYFLGILGERYGWIADSIPPEVLEREPWLKEHSGQRTSVTELEILHGVLHNLAMAEHSFFYFRDPRYLEGLPPEKRSDFASEDSQAAGKLEQLKDRIRISAVPVRENYSGPKALGQLVFADLKGVIDRLFPEGSPRDPIESERIEHENHAASHARVYVAAGDSFHRLDEYANQGGPPLAVLGEPGMGKSALLANWYLRYCRTHPDRFSLIHFIGGLPESGNYNQILYRIVMELRARFELPADVPLRVEQARGKFADCLAQLVGRGTRRLVLDALDQLEDRDDGPDLGWLPGLFPGNFRVILSALPGRALNAIESRGWLKATTPLELKPLAEAERRNLTSTFLGVYGRDLGSARTNRLVQTPQSANPLFLRAVLDELRQFGLHEKLDEQLAQYLEAKTTKDLYLRILSRWEKVYSEGRDLTARSLRLISVARQGLSEAELTDLLGQDGKPLPRALWTPFFLAAESGLAIHSGRLRIAHEYLLQAFQEKYLPAVADRQECHQQLVDYFERNPEWTLRKTDELPWHLYKLGQWNKLQALLGDTAVLHRIWDGNSFDVLRYWRAMEANSSVTMGDTYRSVLASLKDHAEHLWILGELFGVTGHLAEARAVKAFQVESYRLAGDSFKLRGALGNLAVDTYRFGDLDGARELYREQLDLCRTTRDLNGLQACHGNLGNVFLSFGDDEKALLHYEMQETLCAQLGEEHGLQASLGNQGNVWHKRGRLGTALARYRRQEAICRKIGYRIGLLSSLGNQANVLGGQGDLDQSMQRLKEVETETRELGLVESLFVNLQMQASLRERKADLPGALQLYQEAEAIAEQGLNAEARGEFYYKMGCSLLKAAQELGGPPSGVVEIAALERRIRFFGQSGGYGEAAVILLRKSLENRPGDADACFTLGFALERQRQFGEAADSYKKALVLRPDWTDVKVRLASVLLEMD